MPAGHDSLRGSLSFSLYCVDCLSSNILMVCCVAALLPLLYGSAGPKTLCNACGVRYQRQQSKAKSNKRLASERGGKERGSSPAPHSTGGRGSKHARLSATNTPDAAAAAAEAVDDAFSALEGHQLQQMHMAQLMAGAGGDAAAAAAVAAPAAPQHHHGTRRNAKQAAAAAAAVGGSPPGPGARGRQQHKAAAALDAAGLTGAAAGQGSKGMGKGGRGGAAEVAGSSSGAAGKHKAGHPALAAAVAAAGEQLGYYADEGSPPNSNTRILEYEDEEGAQQQQQQLMREVS